ncbi:MAG TPA: hypothetical protein VGH36_01185 [Acetobacteraceae bacterium]
MAMLALLSACGSLPRPFEGNPGATAMRLAQPPPPRLAVPPPNAAMLDDNAAKLFASALAEALVQQELPVVAGPARPGDWRVVPAAQLRGNMVVPTYTVEDPAAKSEGVADGAPIAPDLWAEGQPATLKQAASDAAPSIAALLDRINAALKQSDPNSLLNRPARIAFAGVTGAPGDGNQSLARQMRAQLGHYGLVVQDAPTGADYDLLGKVVSTPLSPGNSQIEITWTVDNPAGLEQGKVSQLHEIPAGSLDEYWGDVALVVAQQAAAGVHELIVNQIHPHRASGATPPGTAGATPPGTAGATLPGMPGATPSASPAGTLQGNSGAGPAMSPGVTPLPDVSAPKPRNPG